MSHAGPEMSSEAPLEEEHCAVALVDSRLSGGEGPAASLVVSSVTVSAAADEVKNSVTDCVDEVERSVIRV